MRALPGPRAERPALRQGGPSAAAYIPGNPVRDFVEIVAAERLGWLSRPHRLCLAPSIGRRPQLPLFDEAALPAEVVRSHHAPAPPPPVYVYGLTGHELGGGGLLQRGGQVFRVPDAIPRYFEEGLRPDGASLSAYWEGALFDDAATVLEVDVPVAVPFHPNLVYGHFLLEMLPRLNILWRLRQAGLPFVVAASSAAPDWAKRILGLYYDPDEIIWYDFATERLRAPCFVLPSMMHSDYIFHPAFNLDIEALTAALIPPAPARPRRRLWLSRGRHHGLHGIANGEAVEATVAALGYEIVHPEALDFVQQIALMDSAGIVAGGYSSAIHNTLFARRGTKVFCVNRINWYQSGIGALRSQPLAYLPTADGQFMDPLVPGPSEPRYQVDCVKLRDCLQRFEDWQPVSRSLRTQ